MGYRTYFTLTVYDSNLNELPEEQQEDHKFEISENWDGDFSEPVKWYDHTAVMCRYSMEHPELRFKLHGEGEENDDLWDENYQNGRYQDATAIITYPPFDPAKLVKYNADNDPIAQIDKMFNQDFTAEPE